MLALLCLNCTSAMCGKCLYSYYYSRTVPHFPFLRLQYCQTTTVPRGRERGYYCTAAALLEKDCIHYAASEPRVLPVGSNHSPANKKYTKDFTHSNCCFRNNCTDDDAKRPIDIILTVIMWKADLIVVTNGVIDDFIYIYKYPSSIFVPLSHPLQKGKVELLMRRRST